MSVDVTKDSNAVAGTSSGQFVSFGLMPPDPIAVDADRGVIKAPPTPAFQPRFDLDLEGLAVPFLPIAASVAVVTMFLLIVQNTRGAAMPDDMGALLTADIGAPRSIAERATALASRRNYLASVLVTFGLMGSIVVVSAATFWRWGRERRSFQGLAGITVLATLLINVRLYLFWQEDAWMGRVTAVALRAVEALPGGRGDRVLVFRTMGMLWVCGTIMLLAVGAAVLRPKRGATGGRLTKDVEGRAVDLAERVGRVRLILNLNTALLVTGIVGSSLLHRWFEALSPGREWMLRPLSQAEVIETGVLYTLLLMAAFGLAETWLRTEAASLLRDSGIAKPEKRRAWLVEHGFEGSLPTRLVNVATMFAPLLAALTQNVIALKT